MNAVTRSDARRSATEAQHYIEQLRLFRRRHHGLKGVFLIQDGDPSDTAAYWGHLRSLVAATVHAGTCIVAERGGAVGPSL